MYKREWTKELEEKAREELNEIPDRKHGDVDHIKKWLINRPHFNAKTDKEWVLNFLRGSKFNTEKAKEKLEYLYKTKPVTPEFYSNRDPLLPELQEILTRCILLPHSTKNEELILVRWAEADANKVSFVNLFKLGFIVMDVTLMESSSYLIMGYHIIVDLKGFSLRYIRQMSPFVLKKIAYTLLKGYPLRVKGIYIFNTFPYFGTLLNMLAPFISKKILERIKIYDNFDLDELCKHVSIASVPKEYGGTSDSIYEIGARWKAYLESYREWFLKDEADKKLTGDNEFGLHDSFKKLDLE